MNICPTAPTQLQAILKGNHLAIQCFKLDRMIELRKKYRPSKAKVGAPIVVVDGYCAIPDK